jgi:hypothetical protein
LEEFTLLFLIRGARILIKAVKPGKQPPQTVSQAKTGMRSRGTTPFLPSARSRPEQGLGGLCFPKARDTDTTQKFLYY